MKLTIHHILATLLGAGAGVGFVGYILALPVWFILGDNPQPNNPILRFYQFLWISSPFLGAAAFNYLIYKNRKNREREIYRRNMTESEILPRISRRD